MPALARRWLLTIIFAVLVVGGLLARPLDAGATAARSALHWRGRSQPQSGLILPLAAISSASTFRERPENTAAARFKLLEATGHYFPVAEMKRVGEIRRLGTHQSSGSTLWSGLGFPGFDELTSGGAYPADVSVAEGSDRVAEVANSGLAVWARTGGLLERVPLGAIFNAPTVDLGDPQIVYDEPSGHWFISAMRVDLGETYFAVSDSSDPTGGWGLYYFSFRSQFCPDQPRLGVSTDVVALTVALFVNPACRRSTAREVGGFVIAIDKAAMIAGTATPGYQTFGPDPSYDNYQPALQLQQSAEQLFVSAQFPTSNVIHVIHFDGVPPNGTVVATNTFLVTPLYTPPSATQRGSGIQVDTGDDRISSAVLSNGVLYVEANDACRDANGALRSCVRVMEVDTTANDLIGETDLGADSGDWYYGAVSPDANGNLIAVFDYSSPADYPSIGAIGAIGPIQGENGGTFTDYTTLATGTAPTESGRYGDYSGAALDWDNPADVWVGSEVGDDLGIDTNQWASHVDSVSLSENALPATGIHQLWYPGSIYRGRTRQGWRIRIHIGGGGRVEQVDLTGISLRCQGNYHDSFGLNLPKSPGSAFGTSGRFRMTKLLRPDPFAYWTRVAIAGQVSYNRITGKVSAREASRTHGMCRSGGIRFTAK